MGAGGRDDARYRAPSFTPDSGAIAYVSDRDLLLSIYLADLAAPQLDLNVTTDIVQLGDLRLNLHSGVHGLGPTAAPELSALTPLVRLNLNDNEIVDLEGLRGLARLRDLPARAVNASRNPLNEASLNVVVPALRARGVEVRLARTGLRGLGCRKAPRLPDGKQHQARDPMP